ncbi:MAG: AAA family ATPase [Candidatus Bathyarchaeia archaeon]
MAYAELEQKAIEYAVQAVKCDNQGDRDKALEHYKKAVELLRKLIEINPNFDLNNVYTQRVFAYQKRIEILKRIEFGESESTEITTSETIVSKEEQLSEQAVIESPNVKWSDVVGLDDVKRIIREVIVYPILRPDLFPLGWPRGILLFGPPGCGKTLLAAAVATEVDAEFISIDPTSIMSKWLGEAEKNVAKLFNLARAQEKKRPVIIFIDELDSLFGRHQSEVGGEIRVRNQFLKEMDGVMDKNKKSLIYVIGATNKPWDLDVPFIRRFQKRIYVPLPDEETRLEMFKFYTKEIKLSPDVNIRELARLTQGYSGSDIRDICQDVYVRKISHLFETGLAKDTEIKPKPVSMGDFKRALAKRTPSVLPQMVAAYEKWIALLQAM